jgi:hypothetical protein
MARTKGNLVSAALINLSTGERVNCMFNPHEYTLTKSNTWERGETKGKNVPNIVFKQGGSQTLKLQLLFDTYEEKVDVRNYTDLIWKMMAIDETQKNPRTDKSDPPMVAFEWGRFYFRAVLTNLTQKFTMFLPDGTPVRTTVDVTLEQLVDENDYKSQTAATPPPEVPSVVMASLADRLDSVAASTTGDASNYRKVAEANNIDNPNSVPPGTALTVPQ